MNNEKAAYLQRLESSKNWMIGQAEYYAQQIEAIDAEIQRIRNDEKVFS